jgi:hypothetical protein
MRHNPLLYLATLFLGAAWVFIFLLAYFVWNISLFYEWLVSKCKKLKSRLSLWLDDNFNWSMSDMQGRGYKISNPRFIEATGRSRAFNGRKADARDRIDELTRELIKANFCKYVLGNPPLSVQAYNSRISTLRKLESQYPDLRTEYSPTQYDGFREDMALLAYGDSFSNGWHVIKRTLWLTKEEYGIKDWPPTFKPTQIIVPDDGSFGV